MDAITDCMCIVRVLNSLNVSMYMLYIYIMQIFNLDNWSYLKCVRVTFASFIRIYSPLTLACSALQGLLCKCIYSTRMQ